jgi:hypothetical protein
MQSGPEYAQPWIEWCHTFPLLLHVTLQMRIVVVACVDDSFIFV